MVDTFLISYDYTPLDIYFFAFGQIYSKLVYLPQNLVIYEQKNVNIGTGKVRVILSIIIEAFS